ncbi:reverse transcriptase domain-containing protein [Tanacetum coccineum]
MLEAPVGTKPEVFYHTPIRAKEKDTTKKWTLFTDGASNSKGSGAGLVLISPSGIEFTYALRLNFTSTNNEAEYKALLAGLRLAAKMQVQAIDVKVDPKFIPSQINGSYVASNTSMINKFATVAFDHLIKVVLVEILAERLTDRTEIGGFVEEEEALRMKINQYVMEGGIPFKKGYLVPMMRCVGPLQANYVIREIQIGACGMNYGTRSVVANIIRQGYYWPTMHRDARNEIQKCDSCQIQPVPKLPKNLMTSIMDLWPFYQWGIDILGPLSESAEKDALPQNMMIKEDENEDELRLNIKLLQERREAAAIQEARYKAKMEQYYNQRVKLTAFRPDEYVF